MLKSVNYGPSLVTRYTDKW